MVSEVSVHGQLPTYLWASDEAEEVKKLHNCSPQDNQETDRVGEKKGQATSVTFKGLSSGLLSSEPSKIVSLLGTKLLLVYEPHVWAGGREDKLGR